MRILVTGAAGYIGSHTITLLLKNKNVEVVALDNYSNSSADAYSRVKAICGKMPIIINRDLSDAAGLIDVITQHGPYDGIIHFAALKSVPDSVKNPVHYYHNNVSGLLNILAYAQSLANVPFIFSSSCSVYGNSSTLPVTELSPVLPAESPYAHTKQIGEEIIKNVCATHKHFKAVILRYFNPVGADPSGLNGEWPMQKPTNLLPIITQTAIGKNQLTVHGSDYPTRDGTCIRDYVHVYDIAQAHIQAIEYIMQHVHVPTPALFNLGSGTGTTVLEAIQAFEKVSQKKLNYSLGPRRSGDVIEIYANNDKAQNLLNWQPQYTLEEMMQSAWKWQQHLANYH